MNETFMKEKPVFSLLVSMAFPMVISMLVNSLYNIVDSYFVAKISEDAMTALSLVFPVQNFINAAGIGFGVGMNAVISFYLGAKDLSLIHILLMLHRLRFRQHHKKHLHRHLGIQQHQRQHLTPTAKRLFQFLKKQIKQML